MKADLNWSNLEFGYTKTDANIRYYWKNGSWSKGELTSDETIPLHMAATCLHYGQEAFEGLKAFETQSGDIVVFRVEENAKRLAHSCQKIMMPPVPEEMFIDAVQKVVRTNSRFVPPHGSGASLYIRPLVIGISSQIGVKPSSEYLFMILVTPVGPYFKTGFKPVNLLVEDKVDRASPLGVGDVKVGGNYAAGMRASMNAKAKGYTEVLFLDSIEKKYIDESGPANFFAITAQNEYITPQSSSILPSITNNSLIVLAKDMGLETQRRRIMIEEIFNFKEAGCCGTAAVIAPVGSITWNDKVITYSKDGKPGPISTRLYKKLLSIQIGDEPDTYGWLTKIL